MSKEMRAILDSERALGKAEGKAEEKISLLLSLVKEKLLSIAEAAKKQVLVNQSLLGWQKYKNK